LLSFLAPLITFLCSASDCTPFWCLPPLWLLWWRYFLCLLWCFLWWWWMEDLLAVFWVARDWGFYSSSFSDSDYSCSDSEADDSFSESSCSDSDSLSALAFLVFLDFFWTVDWASASVGLISSSFSESLSSVVLATGYFGFVVDPFTSGAALSSDLMDSLSVDFLTSFSSCFYSYSSLVSSLTHSPLRVGVLTTCFCSSCLSSTWLA